MKKGTHNWFFRESKINQGLSYRDEEMCLILLHILWIENTVIGGDLDISTFQKPSSAQSILKKKLEKDFVFILPS